MNAIVRHGPHDLRHRPRHSPRPGPRPDPQSGEPPLAGASIKALGHSTTRTLERHFGDVVNVKGFGALGNGSNNDTAAIQLALDYAFGTAGSPHGGSIDEGTAGVFLNRQVFFPAGKYIITAPLTLPSLRGAHIFGAGRFTTTIQNITPNGSVFVTNGCEYSVFERMNLMSSYPAGTGCCFDLNRIGSPSVNLQSNTFRDLYLEGGGYGIRIGEGNTMGSENVIMNCYFAGNAIAGVATRNPNALANQIYGGNFASCGKAIHATSAGGSIPIIHGVSFQNQVTADIYIEYSSGDMYSIAGCRNESSVSGGIFTWLASGASAHITGCSQLSHANSIFARCELGSPGNGAGSLTIDSCVSPTGTINGNGYLYIRGNPDRAKPIAITGAASNGVPNLIRLAVTSTANWSSGQLHWIAGIVGSGNVAALNGGYRTLTVIDGTHADVVGSTFSGAWTSGGVVDGQSFGNPAYLSSFGGVVVQNI